MTSAEVEIARLAQVTILVMVPGSGDDVQAMKAGVLEIADLIVMIECSRDDEWENQVRYVPF